MKKSKLDVTWIDGVCWFNTAVTNQYSTIFTGVPCQKDIYCREGMLYKIELNNMNERYTKLFYTYEEAYEFFKKVRFADSIKDALNG